MTRLCSRIFGKFASYPFPQPIQTLINAIYVRYFGIALEEFEESSSYPTLNALFTRKLKTPREFDLDQSVWIAPCDCKVMEQGIVKHNTALQIKKMVYCVSEFLGGEIEEGYSYLNLYLSPKDYHRFHSPCDLEVLEVRYFSGELLPVNHSSLLKNHNLFIRNERVVIVARDKQGKIVYYVAVGALNVGKITLHFEPRVQTNVSNGINKVYAYDEPILLKKGEEIGLFQMGSTIVLFTSHVEIELNPQQKVRFGERMGARRER